MDAFLACETVRNAAGRFGGKNFVQRLRQQVPERDAPLAVEAAGDNGPVAEHGQLVAQRAACARLAVIWCVGAGPVEFFTVVDKGPVTQPPAPGVLCPVARIDGAEVGENGVVLCVPAARLRAVEIPEAIVDQNARLRRCKAEVGASGEIGAHIHAGIGLERMEAYADLVQRRGCEQHALPLRQERPVRRQHDAKAHSARDLQQLRQLRMQQRLAHHVEIEETRLSAQRRGEMRELFGG